MNLNFKKFVAGLVALVKSSIPTLSFAVSTMMLRGVALAQEGTGTPNADGDGTFENVTDTVCAVAAGLYGPLGIGLGFLVLVAGLIALQVASRDAMPMIARAGIGTALIIGASTAFAALLAEPCG